MKASLLESALYVREKRDPQNEYWWLSLSIYIYVGVRLYEYINIHSIFMSIFKRLCQLDLKIYKVSH
jgi:hypothetical protein